MPQSRHAGPKIGQTVIYTETAHTLFYPAVIVAVNTDGTVRLSTFKPGQSLGDQNNKSLDIEGKTNGTWRYPDADSGI